MENEHGTWPSHICLWCNAVDEDELLDDGSVMCHACGSFDGEPPYAD
jgi:hypothetical protein